MQFLPWGVICTVVRDLMMGCLLCSVRCDRELVANVVSCGTRAAGVLPGCKLGVYRLQPGDDGLDQFLQGGEIFRERRRQILGRKERICVGGAMRLGRSRLFWEVQGGCVMLEVGTVAGWQVGFHRLKPRDDVFC